MTLQEARQALRRIYLIFNGETARLEDSREQAQEAADAGLLVLEYGLVSRVRGANDVMVPIRKDNE